MKPNIILFGTSAFGLPAFSALADDDRWSIVAVVTQPARPVGRKQVITPSPVEQWAMARGLRVLTPSSLKKPDQRAELESIGADLYVVASYGLILPADVLRWPKHGALNIHGSLLPKYRGASPISAAILNGDPETGITFMVMDPGMDTGPMLQPYAIPIAADETKATLEEKLAHLGGQHITEIVDDWLTSRLSSTPQPATGVSLAPRLTRENGQAKWDDAQRLERMVRAYVPWPGVWTTWQDREMRILEATTFPETISLPPGTVIAHEKSWAVVCASGCFVPTIIQFSGRTPQPASSVPGSYPGFVGAVLG